jgi:hypothetical protein
VTRGSRVGRLLLLVTTSKLSKRQASSTKVQFFAVALLGCFASVEAEQAHDGPYVRRAQDGHWIAQSIDNDNGALSVREERAQIGKGIIVQGVGSSPSFTVTLRETSPPEPDSIRVSKRTPLFVIADTHGEFEIATELLRRHRIIDEQLRWSFAKGRLVILGDVFDRGAHHTELLWLIYKLEAEAKAAGGAVHFLLGNHETMVLSGDERYLNPKYVRSARAFGLSHYTELWASDSLLGQWLRNKHAVMKIGDYLCAHGGISPQAIERQLTIRDLNEAIREVLKSQVPLPQAKAELGSFAMGPQGPLWYRGYFAETQGAGAPANQCSRPDRHSLHPCRSAEATAESVKQIRAYYDVKAIFVGHTRVPTITPLYNGDVIAIQVYPHRDPNSGAAIMEGLLVKDGRLFRASADGSVEAL